ncbi:MAG TPA: DUF1653 domain-containing protein [Candidatus Saccharimonadia bacterium]|nr:DUF1653 domain-containing protein [Candidatus Saccharimonadia bacterium]
MVSNQASSSLPELPAGVYRHYKGQYYLVLGYGHDSNYADRTVVVYVGLQLEGALPNAPRLNVRTVADFFGLVGSGQPRFSYVGPVWSGEPDQGHDAGAAPHTP